MKYGHIPGIEKPISKLLHGCVRLSSATADQDFKMLDSIFETGCNAFDTAHCYGAGDSERTLGRWVKDRGIRDKVVIATKGAHPTGAGHRVTPEDITIDIQESLDLLQSDYIDLYWLHRDNPAVPAGPIVEVLHAHQKAGKIRAYGGSNWSHERIQEANDYAREHGLTPFAASSPNFCLAERVKEPWAGCLSLCLPKNQDAIDWYINEQMPLFSWSSLAAGFFSDRYHPDNLATYSHYLDRVCIDGYCYPSNYERLERARQMAAEKGCTIPQIALAYVLNQPLNIFALLGCQTVDEFRENMEALDIVLAPEERKWLEEGRS